MPMMSAGAAAIVPGVGRTTNALGPPAAGAQTAYLTAMSLSGSVGMGVGLIGMGPIAARKVTGGGMLGKSPGMAGQ